MKRIVLLFAICYCCVLLHAAQTGAESSFLDYPESAHMAALGGASAYYDGSDPTFARKNPALLSTKTHNRLDVNYSIYMARTGYGSISYAFAPTAKDAVSVGFDFAQYGKMEGYDASGQSTGKFTVADFALLATYSRQLNRYFTVGATLKPVLNTYETYTLFSLGGDLGVSFCDTVSMVGCGLSLSNFGGRVAGTDGVNIGSVWMPLKLQLTVSKRLKHAPIEFFVCLQNLQTWKQAYAVSITEGLVQQETVGRMIGRKFVIGMDVRPISDKFWIALSYNFDRGLTLENPAVLSLSGLSGGFGLKLKMFKIGVAVACYSPAAVTGHFSLAVDLGGFNKKMKL